MKIFYGIQGTGNGHITRGRAMAVELAKAGHDVTYLFTGREADKFFEMEVFNGYEWRQGLTFHTENGRVSYLKTGLEIKPLIFLKDIKRLDLNGYDRVLCDFEPVTAWASKLRGIPAIGIGHQYAFKYNVPKAGYDPLSSPVMKFFAPAATGIGLHWHHFEQPILPPIIEATPQKIPLQKDKIIVYLPFEDPRRIVALLQPFSNFQFHVYTPSPVTCAHPHIQINPLSRQDFQADFEDAAGVISNAGFELISEALQAGKKILVKPLQQQLEQISNALALRELRYGQAMQQLDASVIEQWLSAGHAVRVTYPNVAAAIVAQLQQGADALCDRDWMRQVWRGVEVAPMAV